MLTRLLFPLIFMACYAYSMQVYEMCPGTPFYVPRLPGHDPTTSNVQFAPKGSSRPEFILKGTTPTDDRYSFKDDTLFIPALSESDAGTYTWSGDTRTLKTIQIVIKDCAVPQVVVFGHPLKLSIPTEAYSLEYQRPSEKQTRSLWDRTGQSVSQRGSQRGSSWVAERTTYADQGSYTFRTQLGVEVSKVQVKVTADVQYYNLDDGDKRFDIFVPLRPDQINVFFLSKEEFYDPEYDHNLLIVEHGSWITENYFGIRISLNQVKDGVNIGLLDLSSTNVGTYKILDMDRNIVAVIYLSGKELAQDYRYLYPLIPAGLAILLLACWWYCCCYDSDSKSKTPSDPADATNAQPVEMQALASTDSTAA